jgi:hypothetical protein
MLKVGTKNKDESVVQLPYKHHWSFQLSLNDASPIVQEVNKKCPNPSGLRHPL